MQTGTKIMQRHALRAIGFILLAITVAPAAESAGKYDPLAAPSGWKPQTHDLTVRDESRSRDIPIRVYLPTTKAASVILFSHGLGGSRENAGYLGNHWSARGFVMVAVQHAGSDTSVWKDAPMAKRMTAMHEAASGQNLLLRVRDIPAVLNQLEKWNQTAKHELSGRLDLTHVGMSGHSFGAVTTQAVSGQTLAGRALFTDPRIKAAVAFSPSSPRAGSPANAFGSVKIPWLLMTGTKDISPIGDIDVASRLAVFPALPAGDKYEVVLNDAEHSAFSERSLPGDRNKRNPNHHKVIIALSTAFWDAYLKNDSHARAWLQGDGPRSIMEEADRWQKK